MEYPINKGVGKRVEFKGLTAGYLFLFAGGLAAVLLSVIVLYLVGVDSLVCILFGLSSGGWVECFTFDSDMGVSAIDGRTTNIIRFEMGEADV